MTDLTPLTEELAGRSLSALGSRTRLRLYRLLMQAGAAGVTVGVVVRTLGRPASTLAHNLVCLTRAGLVEQEQRGREVRSRPDFAAMTRLMTFLAAECCTGVPSAQSATENAGVPTSTCPECDEPREGD